MEDHRMIEMEDRAIQMEDRSMLTIQVGSGIDHLWVQDLVNQWIFVNGQGVAMEIKYHNNTKDRTREVDAIIQDLGQGSNTLLTISLNSNKHGIAFHYIDSSSTVLEGKRWDL